jgi:hypothetical protein
MQRSQWNIVGRALLISVCCWVCGLLQATPGDGRFDLNRWDRSAQLYLDGHWLFMPGRFVEPHEFEDILDHDHQDIQIVQPGVSLQEEEDAPRYGTYILRLAHPQKLDELALLHGRYFSSAKSQVFCRNVPSRTLTLSLGQVGASPTSSTPKISTLALQNLRELAVGSCTELIIMLQVSSFHHHEVGMWLPPRLGLSTEFQEFMELQERSSLFILSILLFVFLYAATVALRRPQEKNARYLALAALLLGLRIACSFRANRSEEGADPWMWQLENLLVFSTPYLVPYFSWKSLKHFLPASHPSCLSERILDGLVLSILLVQLLTPVSIWTAYAGFFLLLGMASMLLACHELAQALRRRALTAWFQAVGLLFAFSAMLHETLVLYRVMEDASLNIFGYGTAIWITVQLPFMAQRLTGSLEKLKSLAAARQDQVPEPAEPWHASKF